MRLEVVPHGLAVARLRRRDGLVEVAADQRRPAPVLPVRDDLAHDAGLRVEVRLLLDPVLVPGHPALRVRLAQVVDRVVVHEAEDVVLDRVPERDRVRHEARLPGLGLLQIAGAHGALEEALAQDGEDDHDEHADDHDVERAGDRANQRIEHELQARVARHHAQRPEHAGHPQHPEHLHVEGQRVARDVADQHEDAHHIYEVQDVPVVPQVTPGAVEQEPEGHDLGDALDQEDEREDVVQHLEERHDAHVRVHERRLAGHRQRPDEDARDDDLVEGRVRGERRARFSERTLRREDEEARVPPGRGLRRRRRGRLVGRVLLALLERGRHAQHRLHAHEGRGPVARRELLVVLEVLQQDGQEHVHHEERQDHDRQEHVEHAADRVRAPHQVVHDGVPRLARQDAEDRDHADAEVVEGPPAQVQAGRRVEPDRRDFGGVPARLAPARVDLHAALVGLLGRLRPVVEDAERDLRVRVAVEPQLVREEHHAQQPEDEDHQRQEDEERRDLPRRLAHRRQQHHQVRQARLQHLEQPKHAEAPERGDRAAAEARLGPGAEHRDDRDPDDRAVEVVERVLEVGQAHGDPLQDHLDEEDQGQQEVHHRHGLGVLGRPRVVVHDEDDGVDEDGHVDEGREGVSIDHVVEPRPRAGQRVPIFLRRGPVARGLLDLAPGVLLGRQLRLDLGLDLGVLLVVQSADDGAEHEVQDEHRPHREQRHEEEHGDGRPGRVHHVVHDDRPALHGHGLEERHERREHVVEVRVPEVQVALELGVQGLEQARREARPVVQLDGHRVARARLAVGGRGRAARHRVALGQVHGLAHERRLLEAHLAEGVVVRAAVRALSPHRLLVLAVVALVHAAHAEDLVGPRRAGPHVVLVHEPQAPLGLRPVLGRRRVRGAEARAAVVVVLVVVRGVRVLDGQPGRSREVHVVGAGPRVHVEERGVRVRGGPAEGCPRREEGVDLCIRNNFWWRRGGVVVGDRDGLHERRVRLELHVLAVVVQMRVVLLLDAGDGGPAAVVVVRAPGKPRPFPVLRVLVPRGGHPRRVRREAAAVVHRALEELHARDRNDEEQEAQHDHGHEERLDTRREGHHDLLERRELVDRF
mmetsp:Transcript_5806/g.16304  ORF Transcript_5806/g.16304 Transcript_5806/m.16304 type:complete len:1096 (-) Transcript_5806:723-4010(-)